jgi:hypothetical protein
MASIGSQVKIFSAVVMRGEKRLLLAGNRKRSVMGRSRMIHESGIFFENFIFNEIRKSLFHFKETHTTKISS